MNDERLIEHTTSEMNRILEALKNQELFREDIPIELREALKRELGDF